jgi:pimeloyl-ACP methyl ester carboxylesterase
MVLVYGLVVSSYYMVPTLKRLAAYHPVYAPDLPGFGESEKPRRVLDVTGLCDSLAAWMREIGLERAAPVGNSFGYQIIGDLRCAIPNVSSGPCCRAPQWISGENSSGTGAAIRARRAPRTPLPPPDRTPRLPLGRGAVLVTCGFYTAG